MTSKLYEIKRLSGNEDERKTMLLGKKPKITIIIPARNEQRTITTIVRGCRRYGDEIIVIDGHSRDKTAGLAKKAGATVYEDHSRGKGEALRLGIQKATGEVLVFIDADGSCRPGDIPRLVKPILANQADHVQGSRTMGGSDELSGDWNKVMRILGSQIITQGINWRFGVHLTDSQYGFRAIRADIAGQLHLSENITTIEQEMIIKSLRLGYRLTEVPVHEYRRKFGDSVINLKNVSGRYVWSWLKYLLVG
jgi:glycosyltransferase involved in cell wall biosynthesis